MKLENLMVKKITEKENNERFDLLRISSIVRTILCIAGGITFISGVPVIIRSFRGLTQDIYFAMIIVVGIITIICSLSGLKYPKIGSYLCIIIGISALIFSLLLKITSTPPPSVKVEWRHYLNFIIGSILIISGSLIGVIGVIKTTPRNL